MEDFSEATIRAVVQKITSRFISASVGTPAHEAKAELGKKRGLLDRLVQQGVVQLIGNKYFPRFPALDLVSPDLCEYCRNSTAIVLKALKRLYMKNGPQNFSFSQVQAEAQASDPSVTAQIIVLGMLMAGDFPDLVTGCSFSFYTWREGPDNIGVKDGILDFESLDHAWQEQLSRRKTERTADFPAQPHVIAPGFPPPLPSETVDFSFVKNADLKAIIERDYAELQRLTEAVAPKSSIILCGSLIEALLLDALQATETRAYASAKAPKGPLEEWSLSRLIDVAFDVGLISAGTQKLSDGVREYRNLVHPGLEKRSDYKVGTEEANIAEEVLKMVIRDLQERLTRTQI